MEPQGDDGSDEAHHFHYEGEAGAVFELSPRTTVVVVGGHGAHAKLAVADVTDDGAAFAREGSYNSLFY